MNNVDLKHFNRIFFESDLPGSMIETAFEIYCAALRQSEG